MAEATLHHNLGRMVRGRLSQAMPKAHILAQQDMPLLLARLREL
jgi:hypothetical protein